MRVICQSYLSVLERGFKSVLPCSDDGPGFNGSCSSVGAWLVGNREVDPGPSCRLVLGGLSNRSIAIGEFDGSPGSGEPLESVRDLRSSCLGSCSCQRPESDDLGVGSAFVDGSHRRGDMVFPSLAASTPLVCFCKTTGAASAKSMMESMRKIRATILHHRIFVRYVTSIRRDDSSERSME